MQATVWGEREVSLVLEIATIMLTEKDFFGAAQLLENIKHAISPAFYNSAMGRVSTTSDWVLWPVTNHVCQILLHVGDVTQAARYFSQAEQVAQGQEPLVHLNKG